MQIKSPSSTFRSPHWLVWSCSRGHRRALHSCTEVVPGNATLPAQALKLCSRFELFTFTFINLADAFIQSDLQCSHPKMAQTQQPAKALPPAAQPTAKPEPCRSRLARRHPGRGLVICPLQRYVWRPAGPRRPHLAGFIIWNDTERVLRTLPCYAAARLSCREEPWRMPALIYSQIPRPFWWAFQS